MGHCIIKLTDKKTNIDYYLEWSSIVDAPVTYGLSLEEFKEYYKDEYGKRGMEDFDRRMERVEKTGTSSQIGETIKSIIQCNRAGENEKRLDIEGILDRYCRNRIG